MQAEIYSAAQFSERAYSEDCYPEDFFSDDGELLPEYSSGWFVLAWSTLSTQHLSDADVHGPYASNSSAVSQASLLAGSAGV